jgi:gluconolactonase
LAEPDGSLWIADARSGMVHIRPDSTQSPVALALDTNFAATADEAERFTKGTLPKSSPLTGTAHIGPGRPGLDSLFKCDTEVCGESLDGVR